MDEQKYHENMEKEKNAWNRLGERNSRGRWDEYRHHRDHLRKNY